MPANQGALVASAKTWSTPSAQSVQREAERAEFIEQSHLRCTALGLSRVERPDFTPLNRSDLCVARERNQRLSVHAAPVMELLFEQIVNTQSMIVLTDAQGTILHSVGDDDFLERARKVALSPGVNWAEQSKGTNAIGTALFEESPTLVHGSEHFMHANSFLTCSAAPIFDPRGNMLGVLDVTGDQRSYHQHTMGLVRMSARMIENHWLTDDYGDRLRLHFHSRAEFIGTLLEGIVVVGAGRPHHRSQSQCARPARHEQRGPAHADLAQLVRHDGLGPVRPFPRSAAGPDGPGPAQRPDIPRRGPIQRAGAADHGLAEHGRSGPADAGPSRGRRCGNPARRPFPAPAQHSRPPACRRCTTWRTGDAQIDAVLGKVERVLNRDIPLLILGETGTGKELLARAVHHDSDRGKQAFVAVNCASIPETLIEAELFGYEDGAFTGARRKGAAGRIVQANAGTLFLDEIGDMPLTLQARLLRVLQERSVTPLGSHKSIDVDIAVTGATHRNLREMISAGTFREDLYYRLNGLVVKLPALRERSDLAVMAQRILQAECPRATPQISTAVMDLFEKYSWPGNVRQLANVLRTAAVMAAGEAQITEQHLSDDFLDDARRDLAVHSADESRAVSVAPPGKVQPVPAISEPAAAAAGAPVADAMAHPPRCPRVRWARPRWI